jgi:hypothetical protein
MPELRPWCSITLRGSFNVKWADYFGEMLIGARVAEGEVQTTTLLGHPIDLTAFISTLNLLNDRHFPILACEYQQAESIAGTDENSVGHVLCEIQFFDEDSE